MVDIASFSDINADNPLPVEVVSGGTAGTQYTEDAAAAANPVGTAVNLIRQDTPAALTTTDGDNVTQRGTNYGAAYTQIVSSAGEFVDTFGGGTQYTEGATDATITGTAMLFESNTGTHTLSVVNATTPLPITLPAADVTNIDNIESYTSRLTSSAGPKTSGAALATTAFQIGGTYNATPPTMTDTHEGGLQLDINGNLKAVVASHEVTNAGTFAVQAASAGDISHDAADSGNPVKIGGVARTANPTAVAGGDRVNASFDDLGRQVVVLNQVRDLTAEAVLTITSSTSETTLIAAAADTFHDITSLIITNSSATPTLVTLRDATGGGTARVYSIAANGGVVIAPLSVPMKQAAVNTNWTITCGTSVASIYVHAVYVKNI